MHLVMILDFLFGFCPGALGYANVDDGFSSLLFLLFSGLFACLVVVKWCGAEPGGGGRAPGLLGGELMEKER